MAFSCKLFTKFWVTTMAHTLPDLPYAKDALEPHISAETLDFHHDKHHQAYVWNHTFYFNCMGPNAGGEPTGAVADAINAAFGSFEDFKEKFSASAVGNFGSGWTWLVKNNDGSVEIVNTTAAGCPLTDGKTPVLTIDVWEHAYYVDKRNARPAYVADFWNLVNWDFVNSNM
ncbi:Superoxide dismutase [Fe] [Nymphon striatum]|nr:Superoxide dismutase [Fe] [Nymphon striatum]